MNTAEQQRLAAVIRSQRWSALATQGDDGPEASWAAYVAEAEFAGFLLHLSRLAAHTRNLLRDPRVCLAISEREREDSDPQLLARVMIQGRAAIIPRETADYAAAARCYQERLPDSQPLFGFADFILFRLKPERIRFVGGFARAYTVDAKGLREAALAANVPPARDGTQ